MGGRRKLALVLSAELSCSSASLPCIVGASRVRSGLVAGGWFPAQCSLARRSGGRDVDLRGRRRACAGCGATGRGLVVDDWPAAAHLLREGAGVRRGQVGYVSGHVPNIPKIK